MATTSIGDALFTKTQQRVLGLLYGKPDVRFYTNEILRLANMGRGTVRRELERLAEAGLLLQSRDGNQNYYQANPNNPIFNELVNITRKTFGIVDVIQNALSTLDSQIDLAFVYGSIAKSEDSASSDIDLLVVSKIALADLMEVLGDAEQSLNRDINPSIYTKAQIKSRLKQKNSFVTRVFDQPKMWIKGSEDELAAIK